MARKKAQTGSDEGRVFRLTAYLGAFMAALLARKGLQTLWKFITGRRPPANPESPETSMREAIGWALATGMAIGVARMVATRQITRAWQKSAGKPSEEAMSDPV